VEFPTPDVDVFGGVQAGVPDCAVGVRAVVDGEDGGVVGGESGVEDAENEPLGLDYFEGRVWSCRHVDGLGISGR
jgi:hypothetical protein